MARYAELTTAEMNPAQKQVVDEIVAGKRGRFGGPFQLLIRAPEVCKHCLGSANICAGAARCRPPCRSSRSA